MITEDFPVCLKYTGLSEKQTQIISAHGNPFYYVSRPFCGEEMMLLLVDKTEEGAFC